MRLHSYGLEDVLVFQFAVFRDLAGGGQLDNNTGGGGCRLQVGAGQWADDRHIPAKGFAFLPWDQRQADIIIINIIFCHPYYMPYRY